MNQQEHEEAKKRLESIDFSCDYGILLEVRKDALEKYGVLDAYLTLRPNGFPDNKDTDYIALTQAESLGLLGFITNKPE